MSTIKIRPPTFSPAKQLTDFKPPSISWLTEEWHVTHSTLPMWKSKRNVRIQYTPIEPSLSSISKENTNRIDDLVTYQSLTSDKLQTVKGIDTAAGSGDGRGEWDWRGKGLLKIASSHWEVLGWGEEPGSGNKWVVTVFAKTLFTPAGIDIYSQASTGVADETMIDIKKALKHVDDENVQRMAADLFEIKRDQGRQAGS